MEAATLETTEPIRPVVRPDRTRLLLEGPVLAILGVAVPSAFNTVQSNLTFLALTALVAPIGTGAIAGYGMGGRLGFLLIPIVFGVGSALIPLVGANAGAGNHVRVREATRAGLLLGASAGAIVGLTAATFPGAWMGLFTSDSEVLATGASYLRTVGPAYVGFGSGLALFFAAQGSGRVLQSLAAGFTRQQSPAAATSPFGPADRAGCHARPGPAIVGPAFHSPPARAHDERTVLPSGCHDWQRTRTAPARSVQATGWTYRPAPAAIASSGPSFGSALPVIGRARSSCRPFRWAL